MEIEPVVAMIKPLPPIGIRTLVKSAPANVDRFARWLGLRVYPGEHVLALFVAECLLAPWDAGDDAEWAIRRLGAKHSHNQQYRYSANPRT